MKFWRVKRGNTSVQDVPIYDKDGVTLVQNLASATSIKFQVKEGKTDATPKIAKTETDGIEVDTPSTGYLRITLKPTDTAITIAEYYMALQVIWTADEVYEVNIEIDNEETDRFKVEQDVIQ